ncbi:MAG: pentapeptide repeat-containing protein [Oscillospiraceae bacterium]|nr:pentapeptide repeat-containing protein [Oscillospiraceae bacterium]
MLPEEKAGQKIDKQIINAGWKIVSRNDYGPGSAKAMAVKVALMNGSTESDYLLFIDNKAIAVIEAKREENPLADDVQKQAEKYAVNPQDWYGVWFNGLIPLVYMANGNKIYFKNMLIPDSDYVELSEIHTPKQMLKLIKTEGFHSLSPSYEVEIGSYETYLNEVINDGRLGNIAFTGDLGIGKSSVIRTYEKAANRSFIYLSASDLGFSFEHNAAKTEPSSDKASQKDSEALENTDDTAQTSTDSEASVSTPVSESSIPSQDSEESNDKEDLNRYYEEIQNKLEKNILVQLISLCSKDDIPSSRFITVPENETKCEKILRIISLVSIIVSIVTLFKLIANQFINIDFIRSEEFIFPFTVAGFIISTTVYLGIAADKLLKRYKVSKFSYKIGKKDEAEASAEINIDKEKENLLDSNLHEILYLFECLGKKSTGDNSDVVYPVFVIEDLDRYPAEICIPILTKLKQINQMLNSRYMINHKGYDKHYKFIYLLNDQIFDISESSRTISENDPYKFFDIIIPILPQLSFVNSSIVIGNQLKKYKYNINNEFIEEICNYVYDYRKLNDILNEYRVYHDKLPADLKVLPNCDTVLFAFIIYKVYYKQQYYKLFKTDARTGEPLSDLMKSFLFDEYPTRPEKFEEILEKQFKDHLKELLHISDEIMNKYKSAIVVSDTKVTGVKQNLSGLYFDDLDLSGRDYSGSDLSNSSFRGSILNNANFTHSILSGADLSSADLGCADLSSADLSGANLIKAFLIYADLIDADLSDADLSDADLSDADLRCADLSGANLSGADLSGANLISADLIGANLVGAKLIGAIYNPQTIFPEGFNPEDHNMIKLDRG